MQRVLIRAAVLALVAALSVGCRSLGRALVFGAGTVQWSWGLDANHDRGSAAPDVRMQQATVNLFADMGVQPGTLQPGLVLASASTDTTAPTSTITAAGLNSVTILWMRTRCISSPKSVGRDASIRMRPFST